MTATPNQEQTHVEIVLTVQEAKAILTDCTRGGLKDSWSGSCELDWHKDGEQYASGYNGGSGITITVYPDGMYVGCKMPIRYATFMGDAARELQNCGKLGRFELN